MKLLHKFMAATLAVSLLAGCSSEPKKEGPPSNVAPVSRTINKKGLKIK